MRWSAAVLASLLLSLALAGRFFGLLERPWPAALFILLIPALGFAVLIHLLFPYLAARWSATQGKKVITAQSFLAAVLFACFDVSSLPVRIFSSASLFLLFLALGLIFASGCDHLAGQARLSRFFMASALGGLAGFFPAAFFIKSYPGYLLAPIALALFFIFELGMYLSWGRISAFFQRRSLSALFAGLTLILALLFVVALAWLVLAYPRLFPVDRFLPSPPAAGLLLALLVVSPAGSAWLLEQLDGRGYLDRLRSMMAWSFLRENLPGILLAGLFFAAYSLLVYVFNHPGMDLTENFLAADNYAWLERFAAPGGTQFEMRAVHPFAFFIFRPLVWIASLLFSGDRYTAAILLVPFTGGLCVFLAYLFVKRWSSLESYALLASALLGVSTTHLLFASLVESYIFSAAVLILFFLLLLDERTHWAALVVVGVLTFGITITNFIQSFIGFFVARPRIRQVFTFGLLASTLAITLTALHAAVFPSSLMFFDPSGAGIESEYSNAFFGQPPWRATGRMILLARNIGLYSVVAPDPFILTTEVGGRFPRFNFFKISPGQYSFSSYHGLGQALVLVWIFLMLAAGIVFITDLVRSRKVGLLAAFPLVILFNFLLHLDYGYEPFLYSADWTYALILFVAAALSGLGKRSWFQLGLVVFLALLMVNQWVFLQTLIRAISPFFE